MIDIVFISDLHLNPAEANINDRFATFIQWAAKSTRSVYILGDFFHVWVGDDGVTTWSADIAAQLSWLANQGVCLFYMHGNRDFLLSNDFAYSASLQILPDPAVIILNNERILLTHGDQYCTHDKGHQLLRRLTRNKWFPHLFLRMPFFLREKLVERVRKRSQNNNKPAWSIEIVKEVMIADMQRMQAQTVIHGHIHKPGLTKHKVNGEVFQQYVLSDWDATPQILCYNISSGFSFIRFFEG